MDYHKQREAEGAPPYCFKNVRPSHLFPVDAILCKFCHFSPIWGRSVEYRLAQEDRETTAGFEQASFNVACVSNNARLL